MKENISEEEGNQTVKEMTAEVFRGRLKELAREALMEVIEEEVELLCGRAYERGRGERSCYRAGSAPSSVFLNGGREELRRSRVRRMSGGGSEEVELKSWQMAQDGKEWEETMMRAVVNGVSMRKVSGLRPERKRGESKSTLSRLWQKKAGELAEEMNEKRLEGIDLLVLMVDGVVLAEGVVAIVAIGIDTEGNKSVLGYRIGGSENQTVCEELMESLKARGLRVKGNRRLLAVLDGSKALKKAVVKEFPRVVVQRCLVHKERNIRGYLSKKHWKELGRLFRSLRRSQGIEAAKEASSAIEVFLSKRNAQALESFKEAGEELLALFRLEVPNTLNESLLSTNSIENVMRNLRGHLGRVCRWREESDQAKLWVSSGLAVAERGFQKIRGHGDIGHLVAALERSQREERAEAVSSETLQTSLRCDLAATRHPFGDGLHYAMSGGKEVDLK